MTRTYDETRDKWTDLNSWRSWRSWKNFWEWWSRSILRLCYKELQHCSVLKRKWFKGARQVAEVVVDNEDDRHTTANGLTWKSTTQQEWLKVEFSGADFQASTRRQLFEWRTALVTWDQQPRRYSPNFPLVPSLPPFFSLPLVLHFLPLYSPPAAKRPLETS